ncbi:hypothetical protein MtrunA17_Chr4g0047601 [Medicago truncatula]|uniref:Uncharacterized protein n=1 Tax=Medicago truncatula TaxID=3880 RepID=A0A396IFF1_MEDTR|nr:hypothetical protein MtrunA17_Chr4g0047601 [Medicago truncatula]
MVCLSKHLSCFLRNRGWVLHNPTKPTCEVRIAPTYKHLFRPSPIQCGTLNTPPHAQD